LTLRRKSTDEILEELLSNPEVERPLRGHEVLSMLNLGNIEPGSYEVETAHPDGSVESEAFRVNEEGQIQNLEVSVKSAARMRQRKGSGKGKTE
jgi:hypothetical protein